MRLSVYTPDDFPALERAAGEMDLPSLSFRPFVEWYYATHETCKLWLMRDDCGEIVGTVGVDLTPFEYDGRSLKLGFGSNFRALKKGAGGILFLQWLKSCAIGAVFGGTEMTHKVIGGQNWTYFSGVKTYFINRGLAPHANEPLRNRVLKTAVKTVTLPVNIERRLARLPADVKTRLTVREENAFSEELLPKQSPFRFRCAPDVNYLRWRYDTHLPFARYRVFRLLTAGRTTGYVITHETEKRISVAQADGENAIDLAYGTLLAIGEVVKGDRRTREVLLTSCHREMQKVFTTFGFRAARQERPLALGALGRPIEIDTDTSNWLVNFDWTDNCLRPPFPGQGDVSVRRSS